MKKIGEASFGGCLSLEELIIPDNVEIRKKGSDSWMRLVSNTTNKTASVTDGLQEETEYEARVQAVDLTDNTLVSTWKTITFTTPLRFLIPSNLNVELTQGDGSLATLTWTENGTATQWQLQYKCLFSCEDWQI